MITTLFYFDFSEKNFCQKILGSKSFKPKPRHQEVKGEALRMEAEAIQKLPLLSLPDHKTFFSEKFKIFKF